MAKTNCYEFRLFCPICNASFTQLVILHKVPKGFKIDSYLAGMVERHDHQAFQAARADAKPGDADDKDAK
ncbi:MAG: hypothetical protein WCA89_01245 [Terracidiphilus sp.]|jgi:hypothetical protein